MTRPAPDLQTVFAHALELATPGERARYVIEACGDDRVLRAEVESLLRALGNAGDFLEDPVMSTNTIDQSRAAEGPRSVIGPYKLLEEIGEGGMGVVYMAEQTQPIYRKVALKIIKPGMDSRQVIARFEAERQALAMMDHPNIARVLDAGTTESGCPYFVMELVKGIPITQYCDQANFNPRERLALLIPVCHAIQHAHQKGIIHRDVKPSNVLVALYDGKPVPKVIDFGVAKAIEQRLTERTLYTRHGAIVGTLEYMSPEQAENSSLDVDTRTDVYSLGVLLYELLSGTTPLEHQRLQNVAYLEILNRIREEDPPKLSTRLSKTKQLAAIAARRNMEPAKLARLVRGELDWIAMKALNRDRARRYESANDLARDLERYLADQPVEAVPPSAAYQVWKYTRKYRVALATAGAITAGLIAATAISSWLAVRATRAETRARISQTEARTQANRATEEEASARRSEIEAKAQAVRATQEEASARRSEAESKAVLQFFRDNVLTAARPQGHDGGLGYEVKLHAAVDAAEPEIAANFRNQPTVEAAIRDTLGSTYMYLGRPADAVQQHERALALRSKLLGPDHRDTLTSMNNLAVAYRIAGRAAEAVPLHERELKYCTARYGPEDPETLKSMSNLAVALRYAGHSKDAIRLLEKVLEIRRVKLGPVHPDTLKSINNLAVAYRFAGRADEAITLHEQELELSRKTLGADNPGTLTSMDNLAAAGLDVGRLDEALRRFRQALDLRASKLGPNHFETLNSRSHLAAAYQVAGRTDEAVHMLEAVIALQSAILAPDHPDTLRSMSSLALAHQHAGRVGAAIKMLEDVVRLRKSKLNPEHPDTLKSMNDLAGAYLEVERWQDAESILRSCLARRQKQSTADWRRFLTMSQLGASVAAQKKYAEAEPLLVDGYEGMASHQSEIPAYRKKDLTAAASRIVRFYEAWGKSDKVAIWREKMAELAKPAPAGP